MSFNHVGLTAKDPIALERFYSRYFGFERARVLPIENDCVHQIRRFLS